ncbi:MAG: hypothetical protein ACTHQE_18590, partial [Thermomicrobiales bacterium]
SMRTRETLPLDGDTRARMFDLATMAFQRKRKTIANGLAQGLGRARADVDAEIAALGIDPGMRPQALTVDDWVLLASGIAS